MPKRFGALLLGAAFFSMFLPAPRRAALALPPPPPPLRPQQRKRLWALVQTRPQVSVLAVSDRREDLEAELVEINETWNHWDLRTERQRYEIQQVCMLQNASDEHLGLAPAPRDAALG